MNRFTFTKEKDPDNKFDTTRVVIECDTSDRSEVIESFYDILDGCGFYTKDLREE